MPVDLRNIGSIAPNGTGTIEIKSGNINLTGTPAPQFMVNGVPIGGGGSQWIDIAGGGIYYNGGNVGIGTSTPLAGLPSPGLHVVGVGGILAEAADGAYVQVKNAVGGNYKGFMGRSGDNAADFFIGHFGIGGGHMLFATGDGAGNLLERMRITSAGNVGIGTTNPSRPLHIAASNYTELVIEATSVSDDVAAGRAWGISNSNGLLGVRTLNSAGSVGSSGIVAMLPNGNVGISTTNPDKNLSVWGAVSVAVSNGNNATGPDLVFGSGSGEGIGSARQNGPNQFGLDFWCSGGPRLSITNLGNVGIGTTAPTGVLEIVSRQANLFAPGFDNHIILREQSNNPAWGFAIGYINTFSAWCGSLQSYEGGVAGRLLLNPNGGGVGVNRHDPDRPFCVDGGTLIRNGQLEMQGAAPTIAYHYPGVSVWSTSNNWDDITIGRAGATMSTISSSAALSVNGAHFDPGNAHIQVRNGICVNGMADNGLASFRIVSNDQAWGLGVHSPGNLFYFFTTAAWDAYGGWANFPFIIDASNGSCSINSLNAGNINASGTVTAAAMQCNGNLNAASITINGQPLALMTEWSRFDPSFLSSSGGVVGITDWKYGLFQIVGNFLYFWASCFVSASSPWVNLMRLPQPYVNTHDAAASAFAGWGGAISVPLANATLVLFSSVQCWQFGWITPGITFSIHGHYRIA